MALASVDGRGSSCDSRAGYGVSGGVRLSHAHANSCANPYSHSHPNASAYTHPYVYAYANAHPDSHAYAYSDPNASACTHLHSNTDAYAHAEPNSYANACPNTYAHAAAPGPLPERCRAQRQQCGPNANRGRFWRDGPQRRPER